MKKRLLSYTACILTALMFVIAAAAIVGVTDSNNTVQAATKAAVIGQTAKGYTLTYGDNTAAVNGYYAVPSDIVCGKITFKKGTYYVSDGYIDLKSTSGPVSAVVNKISNTGDVSRTKYVLSRSKAVTKDTVISSGVSYFTGKYKNNIYQNGELLANGYALVDNVMYKVTNGSFNAKSVSSGIMTTPYVDASQSTVVEQNGLYVQNGVPYTGIYNLTLYKNGLIDTAFTGWKKADKLGMYNGTKIYYFKSGKAVTGWQYLPSYGNGKEKYKYNFRDDGTLRTNLFAWNRAYYIKQKLYIKTNLTTHNTTIYAYDKDTKKYDIPLISAICSTSRKKNGTKPVKKTYISKLSACRWFIYKKSKPWHYYQYGVLIKGSASWYHSIMYKTTKPNKMVTPTSKSGYNYLGTNQTTACIRQQVGMARLIYDIAVNNRKPKASMKKQKERVWVDIYRSKNTGPFGKITLKDSTGTLKKSVSKDPTDPKYGNSLFKYK